ncbi:hypothetical protein NMY22_g17987 [Coprinellus aureogranulatus]|nr:hypothetical protein NMY22_g17987 [Coprinellus aureogranulatus]
MASACQGCGEEFPLWDPSPEDKDTCPKCRILNAVARGTPEYQDKLEWPQCYVCGGCYRNLPGTGSVVCKSKNCIEIATSNPKSEKPQGDPSESGDEQSDEMVKYSQSLLSRRERSKTHASKIPEAHKQRSEQMQKRMRRALPPPKSSESSSGRAKMKGGHTTESLLEAEKKKKAQRSLKQPKPGKDELAIAHWKYRRSDKAGKPDDVFGSGLQGFSLETPVSDISDAALKSFNQEWGKQGKQPFQSSEVTLRLYENKTLIAGLHDKSIKNLLDVYTDEQALQFLRPKPKGKPKAQPTNESLEIHFELFLFMEAVECSYAKRVGTPDETDSEEEDKRPSKKRRGTSTASDSKLPTNKRLLFGGASAMRSMIPKSLMLNGKKSQANETTTVTLRRKDCVVSDGGDIDLVEDGKTIEGLITKRHVAQGSMKVVYKHKSPMKGELWRLALGGYLLANFLEDAAALGVDVNTAIAFATAFIVQEVQDKPSPASGMKSYIPRYNGSQEFDGIYWLIELYRAGKSLTRISGTLSHLCNLSDLLSLTIYAFVHYAYAYTGRDVVFADIQGTNPFVSSDLGRLTSQTFQGTPATVNNQDGDAGATG